MTQVVRHDQKLAFASERADGRATRATPRARACGEGRRQHRGWAGKRDAGQRPYPSMLTTNSLELDMRQTHPFPEAPTPQHEHG